MRKLAAITLSLALVCVLPVLATGVTIGLQGFSVSMEHINDLIEDFGDDGERGLSPLRTGAGCEISGSVLPIGGIGSLGLGGRVLFARVTSGDTTVATSMLGLFARTALTLGRWIAQIDAGVYRGTYSFPAVRAVDLSGWGAGLAGTVGYALPLSERFALAFDLGLRWLPIQEMRDPAGQKYRGRGTPFMDFSGISASIGLTWMVPERRDE